MKLLDVYKRQRLGDIQACADRRNLRFLFDVNALGAAAVSRVPDCVAFDGCDVRRAADQNLSLIHI